MNARQPAEGPPENEIGRGGTNPATDGLPDNTSTQCTASPPPAQPARWQVRTTKLSGATVVFSEYRTHDEAAVVAARLCDVGCPAFVSEVAP